MKKTLLFSVALAGLMLGSCSSSDDLNGGGSAPVKQDGNGYVAFTINLPTQPSTRAGSFNDEFKDGMANEYAVKDATLLLFQGTAESSATFVGAYKLSTEPWTSPAGDQNITTTSKKIVKKIDKSGTDMKALVVLNSNGVFTVDEATNSVKLKGSTSDFAGTYKQFVESANATSGENLTKTGFYMANAPLCSKKGDDSDPAAGTVSTLTDLNGKIYDTEAEALAGSAAQVYVERAVAKVTVNKGAVTEATTSTSTSVPFEVLGWAIDNFNKTTYLVRSTEDFDSWKSFSSKGLTPSKYRFVGAAPVATDLYRTYFAKDVNYDTDFSAGILERATNFVNTYGETNPQYCFENTFDVPHQNENLTTLVTIKAKLNSGADFYIVGGDQTKLYTKTELDKLVKEKFLNTEADWVTNNAKDASTKIGEGDLTLAYDKDAAGVIHLTGVTVDETKLKSGHAALPATYVADVEAAVGSMVCYKNGVSYYTVRIKHFGDDLTPWKKNELGVKAGAVYPATNQAENWLGRYGVLRNNWYDITVQGVKGLGSATVPELTGTTDDELDSYIAVQINVLSWAKRTQNATLH